MRDRPAFTSLKGGQADKTAVGQGFQSLLKGGSLGRPCAAIMAGFETKRKDWLGKDRLTSSCLGGLHWCPATVVLLCSVSTQGSRWLTWAHGLS